jgi:cysteine desulfurase/selenocysteine lyase
VSTDANAPRLGDRSLFPELRAAAYLAHAAVSPPSRLVGDALEAYRSLYARDGALAFGATIEQRGRLRARLATLLGARVEEVAIAPNTSTGVSDIALSFPWERGDRAVVFEGEFPANYTPWQRAAELFGLELVTQDADLFRTDPTRAFEALDAALQRGARLVAVSQVQFQTGHRMPLRALAERCHAHGAELFVDAIQGLGCVPIDVEADGVDYLAAGGHKWLMGVEGAGVLYVRASRAAALRPWPAGWLSHVDPVRFLVEERAGHLRYDRPLRARADVFENGTFNAAGCFALEASVGALLALGVGAIHAHANGYLDALEGGLVARGFESLRAPTPTGARASSASARPRGRTPSRRSSAALAARGVTASTPDGVLRFAPHWPNHRDEVPRVLAALDDAMTSP